MTRLALIILFSSTLVTAAQTLEITQGSVSSAHPLATHAAEVIYSSGGNAVDAAIAVSFVLSVVEPTMSGLGGRAQSIIHTQKGDLIGYNGMTEIPKSFLKSADMDSSGYSTVATPGLVALLWDMHQQHGKLPFAMLVEPAIGYAENGFVLLPGEVARQASVLDIINSDLGMQSAFLDTNGALTPAGKILKQPALAETLKKVAEGGADAFYRGDIARAISDDMDRHGGFVTQDDLSDYKVLPGRYISFPYRDFTIHTLAAPAGGGLVAKAMMLLSNFDMGSLDDARWATIVSQALSISIESMSSDYYEANLTELVDPTWAEQHSKRISMPLLRQKMAILAPDNSSPSSTDWIGSPGGHTSHFVTADCNGLTVSMTQTIGPIFGAKVATPELGFAYAATMGGYLRTGLQNPGERPRTSIAPVIVTQQNKVVMALGAAGGIRIPSAIVQTLSRYIDQGKNLSEAIRAPRIHPLATIDKNNKRVIDLRAFDAEMSQPKWSKSEIIYWRNAGFKVTKITKNASFGRVHAIAEQAGKLLGVADPDWEGTSSEPVKCSKEFN